MKSIKLNNDIEILWEEFNRDSLCSFHQSLFKLVDAYRRDIDLQYSIDSDDYSELIEKDKIVILSLPNYNNEDISNELTSIANYFSSSNPNTIIIGKVKLKELNEFNIEEKYIDIPDSITKLPYQISNYGNVLDMNGDIVTPIHFDDGPRVYIPSDDNNTIECYYSISSIMTKAFNTKLKVEANQNIKIDKESERLKNIGMYFEKSHFKNIHHEFKFLLEIPYLYTGSEIGGSIFQKIYEINNSF